MIGDDILLFPDTGPDFMRSLRTAILYSQRVHGLTFIEPEKEAELALLIVERCRVVPNTDHVLSAAIKHADSAVQCQPDISLLLNEGVLILPKGSDTTVRVAAFAKSESYRVFSHLNPLNPKVSGTTGKASSAAKLLRTVSACTVTFPVSPFQMAIQLSIAQQRLDGLEPFHHNEDGNPTSDRMMGNHLAALSFLVGVALDAEHRGIAVASWAPDIMKAYWATRRLIDPDQEKAEQKLEGRSNVAARLSQEIVRRQLPSFEDIPFEEILEVRRKRKDELQAYRGALRELATQIDSTQDAAKLNLQIHDLVTKNVDPAVTKLRRALSASRTSLAARLLTTGQSIASGAVTTAMAHGIGAPLSTKLITGLIGGLGGALAAGPIAREKLLHESQWSVLIRLDKKR